MPSAGRSCGRCGNKLTAKRAGQRKKYCGRCEPIVKKELKTKAHDRRVTMNGFTGEDYWLLFEAQDGRCAIKSCRANGRTRFLSVDHDHKCKAGHPANQWCRECVRGLCCSMHNGWLGRAGDDPAVFDSLASYLREPPARRILR